MQAQENINIQFGGINYSGQPNILKNECKEEYTLFLNRMRKIGVEIDGESAEQVLAEEKHKLIACYYSNFLKKLDNKP